MDEKILLIFSLITRSAMADKRSSTSRATSASIFSVSKSANSSSEPLLVAASPAFLPAPSSCNYT
ncbi:MAG: hypothetical protein OEV22_00530, partial [Deltaproteobacteria bacterium]|nr:hypothetical protein [Deltaproteobacteria bacterium]